MPHNYMPAEKRDASLVVLCDAVIEPLGPAFSAEGWDAMPLGRFYRRFGSHWHSIAWYTDDPGDIWQRCTDNGIRVLGAVGVPAGQRPAADLPIMTHPKDTVTQLEFMNPGEALTKQDPRLRPDWDPDWWLRNHPLGLRRLGYTTVLTRDLDRARHVYVDVLGGTLLLENTSELTGTANVYVQLGEVVIELARPVRYDTIAAADQAANGEIHHAATFQVADLDQAEQYLTAKGVKTADRDAETLIIDPATSHGAVFRFTTWSVPGRRQA
jgi:catechol 2,3-dioxygenase-like lactoylglutathione lyase family enzyme